MESFGLLIGEPKALLDVVIIKEVNSYLVVARNFDPASRTTKGEKNLVMINLPGVSAPAKVMSYGFNAERLLGEVLLSSIAKRLRAI